MSRKAIFSLGFALGSLSMFQVVFDDKFLDRTINVLEYKGYTIRKRP